MATNGSGQIQPQYLTAKEAAAIARYSYFGFLKLLRKSKRNGLPIKRIGRRIRIPHQKFLTWLGDT